MSCRAEQKNLILCSNAKSVHFVQLQIMRGLVSYRQCCGSLIIYLGAVILS
jgi:hypothetical protein